MSMLASPQVSSIAINANGDAARFARFGLPVLADTVEGFAGPLAGILQVIDEPLVSIDFKSDPRSAIVDAPSTMVVNNTQLKLYIWYDNEMGYAHRLVDVALMVGGRL